MRWLALKDGLPAEAKNKYVFFTSGKHPSKNINQQMQASWKKMGLKGTPKFTTLRSSVANLVNTHTQVEKNLKIQIWVTTESLILMRLFLFFYIFFPGPGRIHEGAGTGGHHKLHGP